MPSQVQLDHYYNSDMKIFENDFFNDSFEQRIPIFNYRIQRICDYLPQVVCLMSVVLSEFLLRLWTGSNSEFRLECHELSRDASQRLSQRYPSVPLHECWLQDLEVKEQHEKDAVIVGYFRAHSRNRNLWLDHSSIVETRGVLVFLNTEHS